MRRIFTTWTLFLLTLFSVLYGQLSDKDRLEYIVYELADDSYLGRGFGTDQGVRAADFIIGEFIKSGIKPLLEDGYRHRFDYRDGIINITGNNIVGFVEGSDPELKDEYIVIGAHYDHLGWEIIDGDTAVFNGADDNASGVASVIELGRIFQERKEFLGRSIILIAFDGEESGLIGSTQFVEEELVPLESIVAMFSIDMIGMYETHGGIDIMGIEMLDGYEQLIADAEEGAPVRIVETSGTLVSNTDTSPFGVTGIPAIHVFTGLESPYHKHADDADLLEYEGMVEALDFIAQLSMGMSTIDALKKSPAYEKLAERGGYRIFNPVVMMNYGASNHEIVNNYYNAKGVFSGSAGFALTTRITKWLAFQPEVLYEFSGSRVAKPLLNPDSNGKLHKHAVTVPVSFMLTAGDDAGYTMSWFQAGGYYSYAFGGKVNGESIDFVNDYKDTDYGIQLGFGVDAIGVRIGYYFTYSMTDFDVNTLFNENDTRFRGSYFRVGYVF